MMFVVSVILSCAISDAMRVTSSMIALVAVLNSDCETLSAVFESVYDFASPTTA